MAVDVLKLAKALCKDEVHAEHSDSPDVIWGQMRDSVQLAFIVRAERILRFVAEQK